MVGVATTATTATITKDGDLNMGVYAVKTNDVNEVSSGHGVDIDGVNVKDDKIRSVGCLDGSVIEKKVSDNLRNSHDAEDTQSTTGASYTKKKTMTFTHGIKGTLRAKMEFHSNNASYEVYCAYYKNGVLIGTPAHNHDTSYPAATSEDIDFGEVAAGETIELYVKAEHGSAIITFKNMRLYYDNHGSAATMVTS